LKTCKKYIVSLILLLNISILQGQLVINEIHPAPVNNQPEWIELFNIDFEEVNFASGYICDAVGMKKLPAFTLAPRYYLILTKDSTEFLARWQKSDSCIILQTSLPTFNNDEDMVIIRDNDSLLLDSIYYKIKSNLKGISLERINPEQPVIDFQNLKASVAPDSSTPGQWNSVSIPVLDVSLELNEITEDSIKFKISNNSSMNIEIQKVLLSYDINNDSEFSENELAEISNDIQIPANDNILIAYEYSSMPSLVHLAGEIFFKAEIILEKDSDFSNNILITNIYIPIPVNALIINEVMYDINENQAEYIELYNSSTKNIILNDIIIHDSYKVSGWDSLIINRPSPLLQAGKYMAITWDSAFFNQFPDLLNSPNVLFTKSKISLNLYYDDVVLLSPLKEVFDSLNYKNSWHNSDFPITKGRSLEKINPYLITNNVSSWTTSMDFMGGTPGRENSVYREQQLEGELSAEPNPFAPDGNKNERFCIIHYELPFENATLDIKIYDEKGSEVRNLVQKFSSAKTGLFTWDGMNNAGYKLDVGPYVLILTAKSPDGKEYSNRILIVIGG
jgi:hypothetical protein